MLEAKKAAPPPPKRRKAVARRTKCPALNMKGTIRNFLTNFDCKGKDPKLAVSSLLPNGGGKRKCESDDLLEGAVDDDLGLRNTRKLMRIETNLTEGMILGKLWEGAELGQDQAEQQQNVFEKEGTGKCLIGSLDEVNGLETPMVDERKPTKA